MNHPLDRVADQILARRDQLLEEIRSYELGGAKPPALCLLVSPGGVFVVPAALLVVCLMRLHATLPDCCRQMSGWMLDRLKERAPSTMRFLSSSAEHVIVGRVELRSTGVHFSQVAVSEVAPHRTEAVPSLELGTLFGQVRNAAQA